MFCDPFISVVAVVVGGGGCVCVCVCVYVCARAPHNIKIAT